MYDTLWFKITCTGTVFVVFFRHRADRMTYFHFELNVTQLELKSVIVCTHETVLIKCESDSTMSIIQMFSQIFNILFNCSIRKFVTRRAFFSCLKMDETGYVTYSCYLIGCTLKGQWQLR